MNLVIDWQQLAGYSLLGLGGVIAAVQYGWPMLNRWRTSAASDGPDSEPVRSTDQPCPDGYIEHAETILKAARKAPADVQVEYLKKGLTQAQVLEAEVERLGATKP